MNTQLLYWQFSKGFATEKHNSYSIIHLAATMSSAGPCKCKHSTGLLLWYNGKSHFLRVNLKLFSGHHANSEEITVEAGIRRKKCGAICMNLDSQHFVHIKYSILWPESQTLLCASMHDQFSTYRPSFACSSQFSSLPSCKERRNGNPLQYPSQENPTDRGAWQATDHGVAKSWT